MIYDPAIKQAVAPRYKRAGVVIVGPRNHSSDSGPWMTKGPFRSHDSVTQRLTVDSRLLRRLDTTRTMQSPGDCR